MEISIRSLELPEGEDIVWQSFNCPIPREGEGIILTYGDPKRVDVFEVVRVTHRVQTWEGVNGSYDAVTIWVKAKETAVGRWSKP